MVLNYEQILLANLLKDFDQKNFQNASYDMRIEQMLDMEGAEQKEINLKTQGMATVIFKEELNLSNEVLAFAHVKTSLARIGIMSINIGIIDPGYKGFISTVIMNYGHKDFKLSLNDSCLRITFHKIEKPNRLIPPPPSLSKNEYYNQRHVETLMYLGDSFLNLKKVENEIHNRIWEMIWKRIGVISIIIGALALVITLAFNLLNYSDKKNEKEIKTFNTQTQNTQEEYKILENKIILLEQMIKQKKDTVK